MSDDRRSDKAPVAPAAGDEILRSHRGDRAIILARIDDRFELRTLDERPGQGVGSAIPEMLGRPLDRSHPLVRIIGGLGSHPGPIVDATAGLGGDAAIAALASERPVIACESHPIMAAILEDGMLRARRAGLPGADRLMLRIGDAHRTLGTMPNTTSPSLVVVDPMFPARRRSSALPPKPMQRLRALLGEQDRESVRGEVEALLEAADRAGAARIVLKRPPDAATPESPLGTPTFEISTKLLRWSVWERGATSSDRAAPATHDGGDV